MAKITAFTTLSYNGQNIARAGKEFDSKDVPVQVLEAWAARGWCSPIPAAKAPKGVSRVSRKGADISTTEKD